MSTLVYSRRMDTDAGMKISISKTGLQYAAEQAIKILVQQALATKIKDNSYNGRALGAKLKYGICNMAVTSFPVPQSIVEIQPLVWKVQGVSATLQGEYYYELKSLVKVADSGKFQVSVKNWSIQVEFELGADNEGRPTVRAVNSECVEGDCDLDIRSRAAWFYNIFKSQAEQYIGAELKKMLERESTKAVNESGANKLKTWTVQTKLYEDLFLDYRLVKQPKSEGGCLVFSHKGDVICPSINDLETHEADAIEISHDKSKMATLSFSIERVLNSLSKLEFTRGKLDYVIRLEDIAQYMFQFKSKQEQSASNCPGTPPVFQNTLPKIRVSFTEAPKIVCSHSNIQIHCMVSVIAEETKIAFLTANGIFNGQISLSVRDNRIVPDIKNVSLEALTINSALFGDSLDEGRIKKCLNTEVLKKVTEKLKKKIGLGFELPKLDRISFVNTEIDFKDGIVTVATDILNTDQ